MAELEYIFDGESKRVELGGSMRIGRSPDNEIPILDTELSRNHSIIRKEGTEYVLTDMGSRNGILHNGSRVQKLVMRHGLEFTLGMCDFTFIDKSQKKTSAGGEERATSRVIKIPNMRLIGQGSFFGEAEVQQGVHRSGDGHVFKAYQNTVMRTVALKVIDTRYTVDPEYGKHFDLMIKNASSLHYRQLARILEHGEQEGYHYVMMEWVEGRSLNELMQMEGRLDQATLSHVGTSIIDLLNYLSMQGTCHGALKPTTIMVRPDNEIKVLGTGLANLVKPEVRKKFPERLELPLYASPEQLRGEPLTIASDIYSLGAILYYCLTGRHVFSGNTYDEVAQQHLNAKPIMPSKFDYLIPQDMEIIVMRMLNKNPSERPGLQTILPELKAEAERAEQRQVQKKQTAKTAIAVPKKKSPVVMASKSDSTRKARRRTHEKVEDDNSMAPYLLLFMFALGLGVLAFMFVSGDETESNKDAMKRLYEKNLEGPKVKVISKPADGAN